jgi:hypothetical protein
MLPSFASLFASSGLPAQGANAGHGPGLNIPDKMVESYEGEACITFEDIEVQQMNKIGETLLIGKFSYGRPVLSVIREHFAKRLKLKGTVSVGLVDPRHVSLAFSNPEDCINTLVKGLVWLG